jgi:hypothetical protein
MHGLALLITTRKLKEAIKKELTVEDMVSAVGGILFSRMLQN